MDMVKGCSVKTRKKERKRDKVDSGEGLRPAWGSVWFD